MYYLLFYDYVPDILTKREPHRAEHLGNARALHAEGGLVMAGAAGDPVDSAVFIFKADSPAAIEAFIASDPYVKNGLVTGWRIKPWNVVVGA
ncbi:MAG: YciI-like protein [Dehalococcoidia bacterium]